MSRTARVKLKDGIYHIMVKSMHEFNLYKNNTDKNKFLELMKKYQVKFNYKLYAYCLMDNHTHLLIDSNGADISRIMQGINQSYAQYYNHLHHRTGHVFFDRFKSKLIKSNSYLLTVSGYIHKNPKDIKRYRNSIEEYRYSSLGIYLGLREDNYDLIDEDYIMQMFSHNVKQARLTYLDFLDCCNNKVFKKICEFEDDRPEYNSERHPMSRDFTPKEILDFLANYTNMPTYQILMKNTKRNNKNKAIYIFMLKCLCNLKDKEICRLIGDITQSRVSTLGNLGATIVQNNDKYKNIIDDFLKYRAS